MSALLLPDHDRAGRIGEFYANPATRTFVELLIEAEDGPALRAVLVGMLREGRARTRPGAQRMGPNVWLPDRSQHATP